MVHTSPLASRCDHRDCLHEAGVKHRIVRIADGRLPAIELRPENRLLILAGNV